MIHPRHVAQRLLDVTGRGAQCVGVVLVGLPPGRSLLETLHQIDASIHGGLDVRIVLADVQRHDLALEFGILGREGIQLLEVDQRRELLVVPTLLGQDLVDEYQHVLVVVLGAGIGEVLLDPIDGWPLHVVRLVHQGDGEVTQRFRPHVAGPPRLRFLRVRVVDQLDESRYGALQVILAVERPRELVQGPVVLGGLAVVEDLGVVMDRTVELQLVEVDLAEHEVAIRCVLATR